MKIKWGALVVDGRNKIGGQVASKNRAGAYLRNKVTPVNPSSSAQVTQRARFARFAQGWRGLTQALRDAWNAAVSAYKTTDIFGDIQNPSGFNLYVRLNTNLDNIGASAIDVPAAPVAVNVFSSMSLAAAEGAGTIVATVSPETLDANEYVIFRATPAQSPGKNFVKSEFRQIDVVTAIVAGSVDLETAYNAKFGDVGAAGQKIFIEAIHVNINTGQVSQRQQAVAVIAA
jgi:hypothetical protein